jgi:hypothetical protein
MGSAALYAGRWYALRGGPKLLAIAAVMLAVAPKENVNQRLGQDVETCPSLVHENGSRPF